jgi:TPR repeat protein
MDEVSIDDQIAYIKTKLQGDDIYEYFLIPEKSIRIVYNLYKNNIVATNLDTNESLYYSTYYCITNNLSKGFIYLMESIELDNNNNYALLSLKGRSTSNKIPKEHIPDVLKLLNNLSDSGYKTALYVLGFFYYDGSLVEINFNEAFKLFQKSADLGDTNAMFELAMCYYNGRGVTKKNDIAMQWIQKACDLGNASALNQLGNFYYSGTVAVDYFEAVKYYKKAIILGNTYAMKNLGECYEAGHGIEKNQELAIEMYKKASDLNNIIAMCKLGLYYWHTDKKASIVYYTKAASLGDIKAMYKLARAYNEGLGVERNINEALKWYKKAVDISHSGKAIKSLHSFYLEHKQMDQIFNLYFNLVNQANKDVDIAHVMLELGKCYADGIGVEKNCLTAIKWFKKSRDLDNDDDVKISLKSILQKNLPEILELIIGMSIENDDLKTTNSQLVKINEHLQLYPGDNYKEALADFYRLADI